MSTRVPTKRKPRRRSSPPPAAISPLPDGDFVDLGSTVADWIETNLVHGEGDFYGEPWVLDDWQRTFIRRLYLCDPETGSRIVRRALMVLGKGNGKTALIGAIMLAELAGPTRLLDGYPALRQSPNIPVAAASYEQSDRLFGAAQAMAEGGRIAPYLVIGEREIKRRDGPGRMYRVTAVAGSNDGALPTAFGADELHEWKKAAVARQHIVLASGLAKRSDGLELNISTPDDAQPDSLLGIKVAEGERVASGERVDPSLLYVRFAATGEYDLDDPKQLRAAIREATPASWIDVERIARRYEVDRMPRHEFDRYHLGRFVRPTNYWLPAGAWEPLATTARLADRAEIVLGFDGSYSRDSTGLVACSLDGYLEVLDAWEREDSMQSDWTVPRAEVDAAVHRAMDRYRVREFVCDPHRWTQEIQEWEQEYGDVVVEFPTNTVSRMSPACARFYAAVADGEGISHDGDPRLARHLYNAVTREHVDGAFITKEARTSPRKIDLAVAAVIAFDRAKTIAGERARRSVYEDRGMEFVG